MGEIQMTTQQKKLRLIREAQKDGAEEGTAWRDRLEQWIALIDQEEHAVTVQFREFYE